MPLKVTWPHWEVGQAPLRWRVASKLTMAAVGVSSKIFMDFLNSKKVYNVERIHKAVDNRPPGQGLVTFCNHHCCFDEPLLWSMLGWRHFSWAIDRMRWTTGAADICFTKEWHSKFFSLGQTIPLVRGDGVEQRSVDFALQLLDAGHWVHIYPEGKVTREAVRLKWGVGRMVSEASQLPLVMGFYHVGMDEILPNEHPYRLKRGKKVTLVVGEPMDLNHAMGELDGRVVGGMSEGLDGGVRGGLDGGFDEDARVVRRRMVTEVIQEELRRLQKVAWSLHLSDSPEADVSSVESYDVTHKSDYITKKSDVMEELGRRKEILKERTVEKDFNEDHLEKRERMRAKGKE